MITREQVNKLGLNQWWVEPLNETFVKYTIKTVNQQAAFIGQCMHESGGFKNLEENLNYSSGSLSRVWPSRFPDKTTADAYAHNPQKIANKVYSGRLGNTEDGDGWKYHGRGLIQLTGKENYANCGAGIGVNLVDNPDLLLDPKYACLSAGWFWNKKNLNSLCDPLSDENIKEMTRRINGGTLGLDDRIAKIRTAYLVLTQPSEPLSDKPAPEA